MVRAKFRGYVMALTNWFDYLSMAVLLSHAFIAIIKTIWSVIHRPLATEAWDTVPELIALSQQSAPTEPPTLDNVSAGIRSLKTMGRVATVESCRAGEDAGDGATTGHCGGTGAEELQLRVRVSWQTRSPHTVPAERKEYGVLAKTATESSSLLKPVPYVGNQPVESEQ